MVEAVLAALASGSGAVEQILTLARRHLDADFAFIAQFSDGKQVYRAIDGDGASFEAAVGDGPALEETFCRLMVAGDIPNVIPDAAAHPQVRDLRARSASGVGSYIGVPLRLSDGQIYGSFCCLSHRPDPDLDQRDVRFLEMLGELLVQHLDQEAREQQERDRIAEIIERGDIGIAAQPIVSLNDGRCVGVEALARFSIGPPDEVFATAHRTGLGLPLERLAARLAGMSLLPLLGPDQYLAVNMSPAVARTIDPVLDPDGIAALHRSVLEITEHSEVESYEALGATLKPLREKGLRLAIDDAGAGYASMRHVIEMQPDIIKIDRSLVCGVDKDKARRRVISGFVLLGLDLDATIIGEGVESPEELETLRDLGVDAVQGYLIARPSTDLTQLGRWTSPDEGLLPDSRHPVPTAGPVFAAS